MLKRCRIAKVMVDRIDQFATEMCIYLASKYLIRNLNSISRGLEPMHKAGQFLLDTNHMLTLN
ncbi:hypothetical protein MIZ01_1669 [Sideroxyarcus emersonii]|uniref:Uncharacterized protein n=1 Tax=Sideroxyarcus emersonii TaxID=2764705 RepID=A0AAN1XB28_9PROT|nr:hypothetical protein MIZ01_1669 [Sideroxyarcus emersonii]